MQEKAINNLHFLRECTPGYYNNEGRPDEGKGFVDGLYGGGPVEFSDLVRKWRESDELKGLRFT